jgi:hypothetical protein
MVFRDGLYRWGGKPGAHRQAVLTETKTHIILTGNYVEQDQTQGVGLFLVRGLAQELRAAVEAEKMNKAASVSA